MGTETTVDAGWGEGKGGLAMASLASLPLFPSPDCITSTGRCEARFSNHCQLQLKAEQSRSTSVSVSLGACLPQGPLVRVEGRSLI